MESTKTIAARSIGERIRQARKSRGLSQSDLAVRIGVSQPAIANWESGIHDPRRLTLAKLADVLDASLDWLAAGDRSSAESDKHPVAAYIRRPVRHVPIISMRTAALFARDPDADPHLMAEDYIPVTASPPKLFAVFVNEPAVNLVILPDTLVVIDYEDRVPDDGEICLALVDETPVLRRWRGGQLGADGPARLEPSSSDGNYPTIMVTPEVFVMGCVKVSIRIM